MVQDFFIGSKSEKVIKKSKKLGFDKIHFVKIIKRINDFGNKGEYDACLIESENINEIRRFIDKAGNYFEKIIVLGTTDKINRMILEHKKTWALIDPQHAHKNDRDYDSYRNSGLNHVLCKIAHDNEKITLFSLNELKEVKSLGRVVQNIKLCKKYKAKYFIVNFSGNIDDFRSAFELKEVERVLGKGEHFEHSKLRQ